MSATIGACRRWFVIAVALQVGVVLILMAGVIPPVTADTDPGAAPERAVPAFQVSAALHLLVAISLGLIALRIRGRSSPSTIVLCLLAFITVVLGLALTDAGTSFLDHGPGMKTASILMFICTVLDLLAAVIMAVTAFRLPRRV